MQQQIPYGDDSKRGNSKRGNCTGRAVTELLVALPAAMSVLVAVIDGALGLQG